MTERTLEDIDTDLFAATEQLGVAKREAARARSAETDAINRVNTLQKEFDAYVIKMKKNAAHGTDWARPSSRGESCP